jgi:ribosomal-protein-alanine N-acetyltransferase
MRSDVFVAAVAALGIAACVPREEQPPGDNPDSPVVARKNPSGVAAPIGAYSHVAVAKGDAELIVLAGQVGLSPEGELPPTVEEQCANALRNVRQLLMSEGIGPENIIKANIWLVEPIDRTRFSELWGEFIDGHPPPTMFAYVARLARPEYLVEVEVWAAR